jgi:hypothetical protein
MTPLLQAYLIYNGYRDTFLLRYRTDLSLNNAIADISKQLETIANKDKDKIYVIGIFFGGLIANNLHRLHWTIEKAIYIGSPMHGRSTYHVIHDSYMIARYMDSDPYEWIISRESEESPPHDYHTISLGLLNTEYDGLLRKIDVVIDNEKNTHIYWSSRWTPFLTYSLFNTINDKLKPTQSDNLDCDSPDNLNIHDSADNLDSPDNLNNPDNPAYMIDEKYTDL